MMPVAFMFVSWQVPRLVELQGSREYQLALKWEQGTLTREEKNELTRLIRYGGVIKLQGWRFPLPLMPSYYVEQYGSVSIVRGVDKTAIRKSTHGRIDKITERV